jgi:Acyl-CoA synthetase (NDP forming)
MGPHYLSKLFNPASIAVFGASDRPDSVGANALQNLLKGGYQGRLYPVNPKHRQVQKQVCYPTLCALPEVPELAIIATPAATIPAIIQACGQRGVANVIILSAGFEDENGKRIQQQMTASAHATACACSALIRWAFCAPKSDSMPPSAKTRRVRAIWR